MNDQSIHTDLVPLKMCSATITLDQYQPDWQLAQTETCATTEARSFEYYIGFENPFSNLPVVHAGIAGFGKFVEHLPVADLLAAEPLKLQRPPRTWRVG